MSVEQTFRTYCGANADMDGKSFAKVCKDLKLLDRRFTSPDVDLIFAKAVTKGQRRINLAQFEDALGLVAAKKGCDVAAVQEAVAGSDGPVLQATRADDVRFHDDKSTYTGVHVNGGPEAVRKGGGQGEWDGGLRYDAPSAGRDGAASGPAPVSAPSSRPGTAGGGARLAPAAAPKAKAASSPRPAAGPAAGTVEAAFKSYCGAGSDMDGKSFVKLCKDCGLVDRKMTATDVDLIFAKAVTKGQRRVNLQQFQAALGFVATKRGDDQATVEDAVKGSSGPALSGTRADDVRFHDDKSTYTGTHVNGGPEAGAMGVGSSAQSAASGMMSRGQ